MIRMTVALTRLPNLSREAFQAYWFEQHGPLVQRLAGVLGIIEYVQLLTLLEAPENPASGYAHWIAPYDGLAEIWFTSRKDYEVRMATPTAREAAGLLRQDEGLFLDRRNSPRWWGLERRLL